MADGLNDARALRVAELVNDFRTLHLQICEHTSNLPSGSETQLEGYQILVRSWAAAQSLLDSGFAATPSQEIDDPEAQKAELRQIILDASAKRFQAHKIYLQVAAARRWVTNRTEVLRSPKSPDTDARLRHVDEILRQELAEITDQFIHADLRKADVRAGHWVDEDPPLAAVMMWINSQH
ncbi:hypothetical protein VTN49DRAFT_5362 [Thermomyces lanuginosus]|uniref:uncharacterized protein n=1 Tax=Thermomyces lanuginosus TaxID=5541 RepID=UPI0037430D6E